MELHSNFFRKIFTIAFLIRAVWFFIISSLNPHSCFVTPDSRVYLALSEGFMQLKQFGLQTGGVWYDEYFRMPVYPFFLALLQWIGLTDAAVIFLQILLSSLTCVITAKLFFALWENKAGALIAGLIPAMDIPTIVVSNLFLSETVFTFFLTAGLYLILPPMFSRYENQKIVQSPFFAGGCLIGLSALVRPTGLPAGVTILLLLLVANLPFKKVIFFLFGFAIAISPFLYRNFSKTGRIFLSTAFVDVPFHYHAANIFSRVHQLPLKQSREILEKSVQEISGHNPWNRIHAERLLLVGISVAHKKEMLGEIIKGSMFYFIRPARGIIDIQLGHSGRLQNSDEMLPSAMDAASPGKPGLLAKIAFWIQIFQLAEVWIFFGIGLLILFKKKPMKSLAIWVAGLLLLLSLAVPGSYTDFRFRVPIIPIVSLVAAAGYLVAIRKWTGTELK